MALIANTENGGGIIEGMATAKTEYTWRSREACKGCTIQCEYKTKGDKTA